MTTSPFINGAWQPIEVDGEPFEWRIVEVAISESHGRAPHQRRAPRAKQLLLCVRLPKNDDHSFGSLHARSAPPTVEEIGEIIRRSRESTSLAKDWRRPEHAHARALACYWGRLSLATQRELARAWLERCERRCGARPTIEDADDLHEISAKTLVAARAIGLSDGDDEAAAQEREVRAAFDRETE